MSKVEVSGKVHKIVSAWIHEKPQLRFNDIKREFGRPDYVGNVPGGAAVWLNPKFYRRISLVDEETPHGCPSPHEDYVSATIHMPIPNKTTLIKILGISESLWYDQLKVELTARCHFMGANVATLLLASEVILYHTEPTPCVYKKYIVSLSEKPQAYKKAKKQLEINLKKIRTTLKHKKKTLDCKNLFHPNWTVCKKKQKKIKQSRST